MSINLYCEEDPDLLKQTPTDITVQCLDLAEYDWKAALERYYKYFEDIFSSEPYADPLEEQDHRDLWNEHKARINEVIQKHGSLTFYGT